MTAEMIRESNQFISCTGIERNHCRLYRQRRTDNNNHISRLKTKKHSSSPCLRSCLRFCFKKQTDMDQREPAVDLQPESTEGGLRELASKWFLETQVPLIVHNGLFPNWFLGFISRKDAEDILKDKEFGCFLIRLSDKALGYILSYKGRDRCRHFVINQSESGQFIVHGDSVGHATVSELIQYYKEKTIEPFGEYLTTSCFGVLNEDLYDRIQISPKARPVATVHAVKAKKQSNGGSEQLLTRNRGKKTQEEVPPLPRRSRNLENGSSSTINNQDRVCYAQVRSKKPKDRDLRGVAPDARGPCPSRPQSLYSEVALSDSRSRSMPLLLSSSEEQCYRLSVASQPPPRLSPRSGRETPSPEPPSYGRPFSSHTLDPCQLASQPSPDPGARAEDGGVYAEVPGEDRSLVDDTYEQIPEHPSRPHSSPYEPVDHLRAKHGPSAWGLKNDKWKRLFPDVKKKW